VLRSTPPTTMSKKKRIPIPMPTGAERLHALIAVLVQYPGVLGRPEPVIRPIRLNQDTTTPPKKVQTRLQEVARSVALSYPTMPHRHCRPGETCVRYGILTGRCIAGATRHRVLWVSGRVAGCLNALASKPNIKAIHSQTNSPRLNSNDYEG